MLSSTGLIGIRLVLAVGAAFCAPQGTASDDRATTEQDSVEFEIVTDPVWVIPEPGDAKPIGIALRIINRSGEPLSFNLFDTIRISFTNPEGQLLPMDGGRDGTRPGKPLSDPVAPGEELLIDRSASLHWTADETLRLEGEDGFGGLWYIDGLMPGVHLLQVAYDNHSTRGEGDTRVWTGTGRIPPVELTLEVK